MKKEGGPFTSCSEVDKYLADAEVTEKVKRTKMKMEAQYVRDSCISLPKSNPVFCIRKRRAKGDKLWDLTPQEFGENLQILISKKVSALNKSVTNANFVFGFIVKINCKYNSQNIEFRRSYLKLFKNRTGFY